MFLKIRGALNAAWHFGHSCRKFIIPGLVVVPNTLLLILGVELAENMSNKQSRTKKRQDKRQSYRLLLGEGINSHLKKLDFVKCHKRLRCGTDCSERRQPREMNMIYGTWVWVSPLIRIPEHSARRITKYTLDSAGAQMVTWEKHVIELAEDFTFFCGRTGYFIHKRIISAL